MGLFSPYSVSLLLTLSWSINYLNFVVTKQMDSQQRQVHKGWWIEEWSKFHAWFTFVYLVMFLFFIFEVKNVQDYKTLLCYAFKLKLELRSHEVDTFMVWISYCLM